MFRIHAGHYVTAMQYQQPFRDLTAVQLPRSAMCAHGLAVVVINLLIAMSNLLISKYLATTRIRLSSVFRKADSERAPLAVKSTLPGTVLCLSPVNLARSGHKRLAALSANAWYAPFDHELNLLNSVFSLWSRASLLPKQLRGSLILSQLIFGLVILLTGSQPLISAQTFPHWPLNTEVKIYFLTNAFTDKEQSRINAAVGSWRPFLPAGITLTIAGETSQTQERQGCVTLNREAVAKARWAECESHTNDNGLTKYAIIRIDPRAGSGDKFQRRVEHEIGHALGLDHRLDSIMTERPHGKPGEGDAAILRMIYAPNAVTNQTREKKDEHGTRKESQVKRAGLLGLVDSNDLTRSADSSVDVSATGKLEAMIYMSKGESNGLGDISNAAIDRINSGPDRRSKQPLVGMKGESNVSKATRTDDRDLVLSSLHKGLESPLVDISTIEKIETANTEALKTHQWTLTVSIQTLDEDGKPNGDYSRISRVVLDDQGHRFETVLSKHSHLKGMRITKADEFDFLGPQMGLIDFTNSQFTQGSNGAIHVEPISLDKRGFSGDIWVGEKGIEKFIGTTLPEGSERFPMFTATRKEVEGHLFPSEMSSEGVLQFKSGAVRYQWKVTVSEYQKFGSQVTVREVEQ